MDLENQIANIFENPSHSDLFKIRWLYLYVCRLFSYDTRFIYGKQELKDEIYDLKLDLKNVEEFEIVCYTMSRLITDVLNMYGYECNIIKEHNGKFSHAYVEVKCNEYYLKLDPTKRHDLTRVKINSNTLDFTLLNDNSYFTEELKETDTEITHNYSDIDKDIYYDNEAIAKLVNVVEESAKTRNISDAELFYEKIEYLFSLINSRKDLTRYDDMDYYFSYLMNKFKLNKKTQVIDGNTVTTEINRVKPAVFFNNDDPSMKDMINIAIIEYENMPPIFFVIKKEEENYVAKEVFRDEAIELLRQYSNPACQFIFENAALRLQEKHDWVPKS